MTDDKHTDEYGMNGKRACVIHDDHWHDDMMYVGGDKVTDHTYSRLVRLLALNIPEGDPPVARFMLITVNGETGELDIVGNPESSVLTGMNLLAKAMQLISFSAHAQEVRATQDLTIEQFFANGETE